MGSRSTKILPAQVKGRKSSNNNNAAHFVLTATGCILRSPVHADGSLGVPKSTFLSSLTGLQGTASKSPMLSGTKLQYAPDPCCLISSHAAYPVGEIVAPRRDFTTRYSPPCSYRRLGQRATIPLNGAGGSRSFLNPAGRDLTPMPSPKPVPSHGSRSQPLQIRGEEEDDDDGSKSGAWITRFRNERLPPARSAELLPLTEPPISN